MACGGGSSTWVRHRSTILSRAASAWGQR
jgi:hypothetical protein